MAAGDRGQHRRVHLRVRRRSCRCSPGPWTSPTGSRVTWRRRRCGSTCSSLASARALLSSIPLTPAPVRRPTATATASSSSSSSGGSFAPDAEPVVAGRPADGVDGVAELAQPVDVVADRAGADPEPLGQLGARPGRSGLHQGEQGEQPGRGFAHGRRSSHDIGTSCSYTASSVDP